jgi:hypothetical protein
MKRGGAEKMNDYSFFIIRRVLLSVKRESKEALFATISSRSSAHRKVSMLK